MLKFVDHVITFSEVPDEVSLCINISNCPHQCPGCHSPYLAQDIGEELTPEAMNTLMKDNAGITCVCLMGGTEQEILDLIQNSWLKENTTKIAWYTGQKDMPSAETISWLDYVKVGPYIEDLGPLTSKTTNQRMYSIKHKWDQGYNILEDITSRFWNDKEN